MGTVVLLIDNSNIFVSGKEKYNDVSTRFSYDEFEKICTGDDTIVEKHIAGSTPPSNDKFWTRMKNAGYKVHTYERISAGYGHTKEKGVDTILAVQGTRAIEKHKPNRVVLLTGDADFTPIASLRDEIRKEKGDSFILDVWGFSNSMSPELEQVSDNVFKIDDFQERLIYFQNQDSIETFNEHYTRIEKEKEAALKAEQKKREEERAAAEAEQKKREEERAAAEAEQKKREEERAAAEQEFVTGVFLKVGVGVLASVALLIGVTVVGLLYGSDS